jgi:Rieske Fe-S protein
MHQETDPNTAAPAPTRRTVLQWLTCGLSGVAAAVLAVPVVGYFLGVRKRTDQWVALGPVSRFPVNETRMATFDNPLRAEWDGDTAQTGVFVRFLGKDGRQQDQFLVFAVNCAHLGCPVSWFPQAGLFMCPCHGGVYYADGERASGPPPRGLFHCVWRVRDGQLEIQAPHYPTLHNTLKKSDA